MFLRYNQFSISVFFMILLLTLLPGSQVPMLELENLDKVLHAFLFAVFTFTFIIGLLKQHQFLKLMYNAFWVSVVFSVVYAVFTELMQGWLLESRTFETADLMANFGGIAVGAIVFKWIQGGRCFV